MTGGQAWKIFFIGLLVIPVVIAGFLFFGIGIVVAMMWAGLAMAYYYHIVSESERFSRASPSQIKDDSNLETTEQSPAITRDSHQKGISKTSLVLIAILGLAFLGSISYLSR